MNTVFSHLFGEAPPVEDFSNSYRCYSFDMHEGSDQARDTLRQGGHVLLPQSALRDMSVASASGSGPMIFNVSYNGHSALVGVHEFTAPEGVVLVPDWLLRRLGLHDSAAAAARAALYRCPLCRQTGARRWAVLENRLRDFICLSIVDIRRDGSTATGATAVHERGRPNFNYNWGTLNYPQHRRLLAPAAATDAEQKQQQQQLSKGFVAFSGSGQSLGGNLASTTTSTTNGSISRSRLIRNCEINMGSEFSKITDY
uniref:LRAT domain-containing protein n=1 Tax=Macrostomum lignano TaxID=282301 RepID=A0A1I8GKK7_9PLAT